MSITVLKPGLLTTIQDLGRTDYQAMGIGTSGALDLYSHRLANWLVGNEDNEATIEITLIGPTLLFQCSAVISICGADLSPTLNGIKIDNGRTLQVLNGDILSFSSIRNGSRAYLAVSGGIQTPYKFGSRSTDIRSQIGGHYGRPLQAKDRLLIPSSYLLHRIQWKLSPEIHNHVTENRKVRFTKGKQYDLFTKSSHQAFISSEFQINKDSNRMGIRLHGPPLQLQTKQELITEGVTHGSIQVPPNGQPIILLSDRQTTGGYPKIAQIASVDLPYLAQKKPGEMVFFEEVTLQESQKLYGKMNQLMRVQKAIIKEGLKGVIQYGG
ncbi:biotin-dependent carboxyltransferase family protein [Robertmurraya korlensis]|uniref:5-oxoprolinase subunit C family protein n=1 Tax=Robertmurraya korlensis TaxID=519977 RepID=UPI00203AE575|nr:biotin-dependent carboxyltransferase family protein [Robertmurraya korlensis]MCM3601543.1 biotin-dependent carboxyltransferase family protein [Robertmurraya korlensis]